MILNIREVNAIVMVVPSMTAYAFAFAFSLPSLSHVHSLFFPFKHPASQPAIQPASQPSIQPDSQSFSASAIVLQIRYTNKQ